MAEPQPTWLATAHLQLTNNIVLTNPEPLARERLNAALRERGIDPATVAEGPMIQLDAAGVQDIVSGVVDGALLMAPCPT